MADAGDFDFNWLPLPPSAEGMTHPEQLLNDVARMTAYAAVAFSERDNMEPAFSAELHERALVTTHQIAAFMIDYIILLRARLEALGGDTTLPSQPEG